MGEQEPGPNPYKGPLATTDALPKARRPGAVAWFVVALIAIPAFGFGFFFTCLGALVLGQSVGIIGYPPAPLIFGLVGGLVGIIFVVYIGGETIKKQRLRAEAIDEEARQQRGES